MQKEITIPPHLTLIQAILLGILQGLTEFLPVSSTAHMEVIPQLFKMEDPGATFSAICQLGPIVAIIAYFRNDLAKYIKGMGRTSGLKRLKVDADGRIGWFTVMGTLPLMVFGLLLEHKIDTSFRSLKLTAASLIILALVLLAAEMVGKRNRNLETMTLKESQVIGWAQVFALIPGTSRSGVTMTAGLFQGLDRESAARFSFLLSIPAITLAGLYKVYKAAKGGGIGGELVPDLVAALVAGVVAYVIINWFLGFMKEHTTKGFIVYRIALGVLILILLRANYLHVPPVAP